jgi:hypothetical protein
MHPSSNFSAAMRSNQAMTRLLSGFRLDDRFDPLLPFSRLLRPGLVKKQGGVFWRATLPKKLPKVGTRLVPDLTGLEATGNKIHIEDYASSGDTRTLLGHGLLLANCLCFMLSGVTSKRVRQIISLDKVAKLSEPNVCIHTFHLMRDNEQYLDDELDNYEQPVLSLDSGRLTEVALA